MDKRSFFKILVLTIYTSAVAWFLVFSLNEYTEKLIYFNEKSDVEVVSETSKEPSFNEGLDEPQIDKELGGEGDFHSIGGVEQSQEITSEPLESISSYPDSNETLTVEGVIYHTNQERAKEGVASLINNEKLALAAWKKMNDMFDSQYFAHNDPDGGMGAGYLAETAGYEYILIGENLAMGNFFDDEDLVNAWMNSPGHRLNIIKEDYSEIGVAVGEGEYQGRNVWMAVQIFGRPLSECPSPEDELKNKINNNDIVLEVLLKEIDTLEQRINEGGFSSSREYREVLEQYNRIVEKYNQTLEETKLLIERLNAQIEIFNKCIES